MNAELYIVSESFQYNTDYSPQEIENKIKSLAEDFRTIKTYKSSNKVFVNENIYDVEFINGTLLKDLLYNSPKAKEIIDRDLYNALQKIIIESKITTFTTDEVKEILLPECNEDHCYGLIAFHEIENVGIEYQIIYNSHGWYEFRRHFLGIYPKNPDFFIEECTKYFPNLFFHARNKETVRVLLGDCSRKIIFHLAALNDKFRTYINSTDSRSEVLRKFSIGCKLDETATLEGNATRKTAFTFQFYDKVKKADVDICCEPHLKLCFNDNHPGDASYSNDRRIYFHEGHQNVQEGRILIGHIGEHL